MSMIRKDLRILEAGEILYCLVENVKHYVNHRVTKNKLMLEKRGIEPKVLGLVAQLHSEYFHLSVHLKIIRK